MYDRRGAGHEDSMHGKRGAGHEECMTGGIHDEECTTRKVQDMRNVRQRDARH